MLARLFTGVGVLALTFAAALPAYAADEPPAPQPQAYWSTPGDGRLVMLARNAAGFNKPIAFRVRVCVTNFTGSNNAVNLMVWTTLGLQKNATASAQPQTRTLQLGDCVEIDSPAAVILQDSTVSGTTSGYYQLLQPTALPNGVTTAQSASIGGPLHRDKYEIQIGDPHPQSVGCKPLPTPTPDFYKSCPVALPTITMPGVIYEGVRLCIGGDFAHLSDNTDIDYAASLIDLIVDAKLQNQPKPSPYDYNWNPVTPNGCHDLIGANFAAFMIGPKDPGGYWDPSKVSQINVTLQTITVRRQ
jgi:hypothetical protein